MRYNPLSHYITPEDIFNSLGKLDLVKIVRWYQYETAKRFSLIFGIACIILILAYILFSYLWLFVIACSTLGLGVAYYLRSILAAPTQNEVDLYKIELLHKAQLLTKIFQNRFDKRVYKSYVVYIGLTELTLANGKTIPNMPTGEICSLTHIEDNKLQELFF